jgi:SulP family sulfate permease
MIPETHTSPFTTDRLALYSTPDDKSKNPSQVPSDCASKSQEPPLEIELSNKKEKNLKAKADLIAYYKNEILVGIIVGFVLVPQECAYAFIGHMDPSLGTHSAWIVGITCAIFGGRPGMINGLTGGIASLASDFIMTTKGKTGAPRGIEEYFISTMIAGLMVACIGLLKFGKYQVLIPASVKVGFCNGLAIIVGIFFFY